MNSTENDLQQLASINSRLLSGLILPEKELPTEVKNKEKSIWDNIPVHNPRKLETATSKL